MSTADEIAEFVVLWGHLQDLQLNNQEDVIRWRWTADGRYIAKSAYAIQFAGSYSSFNSMAIWRAKAEGKHRFFGWLLVQCKLLTADKLLLRNLTCNPVCPLCVQDLETTEHLCLHCVYAREVWLSG
jgi:hypothetical protein